MSFKIAEFSIFSRRDENLIVIFPEIPYWIATTKDGYSILTKIKDGKDIKQIAKEIFGDVLEEHISEIRAFLAPLIESNVINNKKEPINNNVIKSIRPNKITFLQTMACNLRCKHCCVSDMPDSGFQSMPLMDAKKILKRCLNIMDQGRKSVAFLGGEPLCGEEFPELLRYAHELGYKVGLSTNGILVDEKFARIAKESNAMIQISLDGATKESHEMIRGKGTWEKTLKAIDLLNDYGVDMETNMVYHSENINEIKSYFELVRTKNIKKIRLISLMNMGRAVGNLEMVPLDRFVDIMNELIINNPEFIDLIDETSFMGLILNAKFSQKMISCGAGQITITISPLGDVYPCLNLYDEKFKMCNLLEDDYISSFSNSKIREDFRKINIATINPVCGECELKYFCGGKCRGETFQETGDEYAPYPHCSEWKNALEKVFWLLVDFPTIGEEKYKRVLSDVQGYVDLWH